MCVHSLAVPRLFWLRSLAGRAWEQGYSTHLDCCFLHYWTVNKDWELLMWKNYHIAGNFQGRKLANFAVLWLFAKKVFSAKFGGMGSIGAAKGSNLCKFSPSKLYFSPIHSIKSFPLYDMSFYWKDKWLYVAGEQQWGEYTDIGSTSWLLQWGQYRQHNLHGQPSYVNFASKFQC